MNDDELRELKADLTADRSRRNVFRWGRAWVPRGEVGFPDDGKFLSTRVHRRAKGWFVKCRMRDHS